MIERKTKSSYTHAQPTHQINNATKWILYGWLQKKTFPTFRMTQAAATIAP